MVKKKRGRKAIPLMWSRVIDSSELLQHQSQLFDIEKDMLEIEVPEIKFGSRSKIDWAPLFDPKVYWEETTNKTLDTNVLSKRQLKTCGKLVTNLRELFVDRARELAYQGGQVAGS